MFYARWNVELALLILFVTALSYAMGLAFAHIRSLRARRVLLISGVGVYLLLLGYFKYFNLIGRSVTAVFALFGGSGVWRAWDILLPVGISFFTFQAISYIIDVYRGDLPAQRHFGYYALYISFFPQLVAGPIERAGSLLPQLRADRMLSRKDISVDLRQLLGGYFRKLVIADLCAPLVQAVYDCPAPDGSAVAIGTLLFAAQIYGDFSGYSMIAAGSARLLSIRLVRNFDRPYAAQTIREFWRRWHISLSVWFTDYVYIPLGGSRRGLRRQILSTLAVFSLSGLWHGAKWTFIVWGLFHGLCMTLHILGRRAAKRLGLGEPRGALRIVERIGTMACVCTAWVFFRAESVAHAFDLLSRLFAPLNLPEGLALLAGTITRGSPIALLLMVLVMMLVLCRLPAVEGEDANLPDMAYVLLLLAIALAWLIRIEGGQANAFIYFQF